MPAFLAAPSGSNRRIPAIVLMHERYGLVRHTLDMAQRFAREGFLCIAPNFFYKHPNPAELENDLNTRYDLTDPESVDYLNAAVDALRDVPKANPDKVAVMGMCQTGRHPLLLAAGRPISAVLIWYGAAAKREWVVNEAQPRPFEQVVSEISCPVFGMFGEADHIISIDDVRRLRDCLEQNKKTYQIHIMPNAPHGWLNDTMPGRYRREQAEAGWAIQRAFLNDVFSGKYEKGSVSWSFASSSSATYDFLKNVRLA
jgi:carboxymethylenebutenolidase